MNIKRSLLIIVTAICLYTLVLALGQSSKEPQVQAQLELYQTNLILNVAEFKEVENNDQNQNNIGKIAQSIVGLNPYENAETQYQKALSETENSFQELTQNQVLAGETPRQQLKKDIAQNQELIDELNLKLGIITASQNKLDSANNYWQKINNSKIGETLTNLWSKSPQIPDNAETIIEEKLNNWFKLTSLEKLYTIQNNTAKLAEIEVKQQTLAQKALNKLLFLSIIPVVGGLMGTGLILFLGIQALIKKENSILATNYNQLWETPWGWETILQVIVIGFFFLSQFIFPIVFGIVGFDASALSLRGKAFYVLFSYLLMASGGLLVLYFSVKSFFPLPENWFKFINKKWYLWGIGGYIVAIPLVFFVSLLNQQIWHGQGGSNPLLFLALKSQDTVALIIFFITASILAPIFEEIIFRGFLLPSLTRYLPVSVAIIVTGIIFALVHLSLSEAIPLATLGILLGIVYTRSQSLLASITLHSLWNSGTLISLFILGSNLD